MLISIIVPVYNVKDYLIKCLESIYNQTLKNYEVIIVDDGSTDGCSKIIDDYCKDKNNFYVYHKKNGGLMSAWLEGVKHISGDYIGFVDSDDYIEATMFEKMVKYAEDYRCDIVMCDRYDVYHSDIKISKSCIEPGLYQGKEIEKIYKSILPTFNGKHITNARWNKIFRKEIFLKNIKYCNHKSRICEDRFITPACIFSAKSFYYLDEPLYYYVQREGSNHSKSSEKLQDAMELLYQIQKKVLKDNELEEQYVELVERANLNYLRLMLERNFADVGNEKVKIKLAKRILESKEYRYCIKKYKNDLSGKLGFILKILFKINSPYLFVKACKYIGK